MTNPTQLVRDLDADAIRDRLDVIEHERQALMVLLRAALRAHREPPRRPSTASATPPAKPKRKAARS